MRLRATASAALACLVLTGAACSSSDSATTTTQEATSSTSTTSLPQNFQVSTPDGQVSLSLDGKLPPGWPKDFPVPDSAVAAGSGSLGTSADSVVRVGVYTTGESGDATLDFYTNDPDLVTTGRNAAGVGDNFVGRLSLTSPYTGTINVVSRQGTTYLVVVLKGDTTASTTSTTGPGGGSSTAPPSTIAPDTPQ